MPPPVSTAHTVPTPPSIPPSREATSVRATGAATGTVVDGSEPLGPEDCEPFAPEDGASRAGFTAVFGWAPVTVVDGPGDVVVDRGVVPVESRRPDARV